MSLIAILLIVVLLGGFSFGYPRAGAPGYWGAGWGGGGVIGTILIIVIVLAVLGRL